jgi:hypothetical protein
VPYLLRRLSSAQKTLLRVIFFLFSHTFCKGCLKVMFKPHKNPEYTPNCPLCREPIDPHNIGYDLIATQIINELQVMCPVRGCPWKGDHQLLENHYNYQCRMKQVMERMGSRVAAKIDLEEGEDDMMEKVN